MIGKLQTSSLILHGAEDEHEYLSECLPVLKGHLCALSVEKKILNQNKTTLTKLLAKHLLFISACLFTETEYHKEKSPLLGQSSINIQQPL